MSSPTTATGPSTACLSRTRRCPRRGSLCGLPAAGRAAPRPRRAGRVCRRAAARARHLREPGAGQRQRPAAYARRSRRRGGATAVEAPFLGTVHAPRTASTRRTRATGSPGPWSRRPAPARRAPPEATTSRPTAPRPPLIALFPPHRLRRASRRGSRPRRPRAAAGAGVRSRGGPGGCGAAGRLATGRVPPGAPTARRRTTRSPTARRRTTRSPTARRCATGAAPARRRATGRTGPGGRFSRRSGTSHVPTTAPNAPPNRGAPWPAASSGGTTPPPDSACWPRCSTCARSDRGRRPRLAQTLTVPQRNGTTDDREFRHRSGRRPARRGGRPAQAQVLAAGSGRGTARGRRRVHLDDGRRPVRPRPRSRPGVGVGHPLGRRGPHRHRGQCRAPDPSARGGSARRADRPHARRDQVLHPARHRHGVARHGRGHSARHDRLAAAGQGTRVEPGAGRRHDGPTGHRAGDAGAAERPGRSAPRT